MSRLPKIQPPFPVYQRFPEELSAATSPSFKRIVRSRVGRPEFVEAAQEFKRAFKAARAEARKQCVARHQESK